MKEVIPPVDRSLIEKELTKERFLRETNYSNNELYVINHHNAPNTMMEIGRLREITFRNAGGGTGKEADIDKFDKAEIPYEQLIVWDPEKKEILGGYRYILGNEVIKGTKGEIEMATSRLFNFSETFYQEYLPYIIELGRSFVVPNYQSTGNGKKGVYVLDNLWDGLGAIYLNNPGYKYFFGKVTMYTSYDKEARNMILYFMDKHFKGDTKIMSPKQPLQVDYDYDKIKSILTSDDPKEDMKSLSQAVRNKGEVIPPLINAYINLSSSLKCFGTVINTHFGDVEETAILVTFEDMYEKKVERHISSFNKGESDD